MVCVDTLLNVLNVIYTIALSTSFIIMHILRPIFLNVVFHKDPYWVPYCLLYTLMIYVISQFILFNIMYADHTSVLLNSDDLNDLTFFLNKEI